MAAFFAAISRLVFRGRGGIGIRAALRWLWSQGLGGSSPLVRIVDH